MHSKRIDLVSQYLTYRGEAEANTSEAAPAWRIRRIFRDCKGQETTEFAQNSISFSQSWNNRYLLQYGDQTCLHST